MALRLSTGKTFSAYKGNNSPAANGYPQTPSSPGLLSSAALDLSNKSIGSTLDMGLLTILAPNEDDILTGYLEDGEVFPPVELNKRPDPNFRQGGKALDALDIPPLGN
ncbi:uncharacterized protein EI90DRAFT_3129325 [Cantharellus anzutake]|uniref:uncharacterized protein n=1 Tax=Cantharellus anzutake TaxID=1750568 RepID=UPI001905B055|nr:uncharacterized protein EI90DRAFT_3129325 [Cantharellus anzutake]KAF8325000.1 hypothetical protein EI90DRAFT_3129325 [Cantharellus anzutake]